MSTEHYDALRNLLAIIHRDGGHYYTEHGSEKAVEDAHQIWAELQAYKVWAEDVARPALEAKHDHIEYALEGFDGHEFNEWGAAQGMDMGCITCCQIQALRGALEAVDKALEAYPQPEQERRP